MANLRPRVRLEWLREGLRFRGEAPDQRAIAIDGASQAAPSPTETLLLAAASCAASDVVLILKKMRVGLEQVVVAMEGTRREQEPRRFTAIRYHWSLRGSGLDDAKARRAIDLSLEKYCSVVASLAPDIEISYDVEIG